MLIIGARNQYYRRQVALERIKEEALLLIDDTMLDVGTVAASDRDAGAHENPDRSEQIIADLLLLPVRRDPGHLCPSDCSRTKTEETAQGNG